MDIILSVPNSIRAKTRRIESTRQSKIRKTCMQTIIELKNSRFPKLLSELTHSNQFLKIFSVASLAITLIALTIIFFISSRAPLVLTIAQSGQELKSTELPKADIEIQAAVTRYLELRYKWRPENVKQNLFNAQAFIYPNAVKAYQSAAAKIIKFSTEKQVAQKVFSSSIGVDLSNKVVTVLGDRITAVQGLKAAGDLRLELSLEFGARTLENPWGVYITKEREL